MRGVSVVQQQRQLSIKILTNASIKIYYNTKHYRKSAVLKQKARSRSRYIHIATIFLCTLLLSSFWTSRGHRCRSFSPPVLDLQFSSPIGFSNPTARRFRIPITRNNRAPIGIGSYDCPLTWNLLCRVW